MDTAFVIHDRLWKAFEEELATNEAVFDITIDDHRHFTHIEYVDKPPRQHFARCTVGGKTYITQNMRKDSANTKAVERSYRDGHYRVRLTWVTRGHGGSFIESIESTYDITQEKWMYKLTDLTNNRVKVSA